MAVNSNYHLDGANPRQPPLLPFSMLSACKCAYIYIYTYQSVAILTYQSVAILTSHAALRANPLSCLSMPNCPTGEGEPTMSKIKNGRHNVPPSLSDNNKKGSMHVSIRVAVILMHCSNLMGEPSPKSLRLRSCSSCPGSVWDSGMVGVSFELTSELMLGSQELL